MIKYYLNDKLFKKISYKLFILNQKNVACRKIIQRENYFSVNLVWNILKYTVITIYYIIYTLFAYFLFKKTNCIINKGLLIFFLFFIILGYLQEEVFQLVLIFNPSSVAPPYTINIYFKNRRIHGIGPSIISCWRYFLLKHLLMFWDFSSYCEEYYKYVYYLFCLLTINRKKKLNIP